MVVVVAVAASMAVLSSFVVARVEAIVTVMQAFS